MHAVMMMFQIIILWIDWPVRSTKNLFKRAGNSVALKAN